MRQPLRNSLKACVVVAVLSFIWTASQAEIIFGNKRFGSGRYFRHYHLEFSKQGKFFSTTDPGITGKSAKKNISWTSDGSETLCGVEFNYPLKPHFEGQFDRFKDGKPLFDKAVIWWGDEVPAPGTWSACVLTTDGKYVRLNPDNDGRLYPSDRSTVRFKPLPVKKFLVGLKKLPDGKPNPVTVRNINVYIQADQNHSLTNCVNVAEQDAFMAAFSVDDPGVVAVVLPGNDWLGTGVPLFTDMTPVIDVNGATIAPEKKDAKAEVSKDADADVMKYPMTFNLPGEAGEVIVNVEYRFRPSDDKAISVKLTAEDLPDNAKLAYRFYGPTTFFGDIAKARPTLSGDPIEMRTPCGKVKFLLDEAKELRLSEAKDKELGKNNFNEPFGWIELKTTTDDDELGLAISLPVGAAGMPQPETRHAFWRPSLANSGDEVLGPFNLSDLELLEEIDCGDPKGSHPIYDCVDDPLLPVLRKEFGDEKLSVRHKYKFGWLTFLKNPGKFKAPVTTIAGQRCRAIPDEIGSYFRFDLDTKLKPDVTYLVEIEHAFDKTRRGEFHSIVLDKRTNKIVKCIRFIYGGLEAEPTPDGGFRKEYVLCKTKREHFFGWRDREKHSLVFSNIVKSGPWIKVPGPAVKSVRIYKVNTMPELPDLEKITPPSDKRRSITVWTEFCYEGGDAQYVTRYPKLVGYNAIMSHRQTPQFLGTLTSHNWDTDFHDWTHPGSVAGNKLLFDAAEKNGLFVNTYLGFLLYWGFEGVDADSFGVTNMYHCVTIPLKPTSEELDQISGALEKSLDVFAKYRSLKDVVVKFAMPFTRRDLEDFNAATNADLAATTSRSENLQALVKAGPEMVGKWQDWACANRFRFLEWLLDEIQDHRSDLFITLDRYWEQDESSEFQATKSIFGKDWRITSEQFAAAGVNDFIDFQRLLGIDPEKFKGNPDFSYELEARARLNSTRFPPIPGGDEIPEFYGEPWFEKLRECFQAGGLGITFNQRYEMSTPYCTYMCAFLFPKTEFRRELVKTVLDANARNVTIGQYNQPWGARLADFREFAVPFRMLPFAEPEPYAGKLVDTAKQAVIHRYGDRYGLINNGGDRTVVDLELPPGKTTVVDLSEGIPWKLETFENASGFPSVKIPMRPWSLKTLKIK